jgi:hypothetical protein
MLLLVIVMKQYYNGCTTKMAGEVVVDALPYFDQGYDETGVRDAVRK